MLKNLFLLFASMMFVLIATSIALSQTDKQIQKFTLYAPSKNRETDQQFCFSFREEKIPDSPLSCELFYGKVIDGVGYNWFNTRYTQTSRSKILDLGEKKWSDSFNVPPIRPLPEWKTVESKQVINNAKNERRSPLWDASESSGGTQTGGGPNRDPYDPTKSYEPDNSPIRKESRTNTRTAKKTIVHYDLAKVRVKIGHIYVIRVFDTNNDFYVLFRVESQEKGDRCTITWRRISSPEK